MFYSLLLETKLHKKRLFLSACSAVNSRLADSIIRRTGCYSIIGANQSVHFDDAAIFWSSFYQLMFKKNRNFMKREILETVLKKLAELHNMPLKYYATSKNSLKGWEEVNIKNDL